MLQFLPFLKFLLNPMKLLELALTHWKPILIILALGAVWWVWDDMKDTIEEQKTEIAELTQRLNVCKDNQQVLENAISKQNETIDRAKEAGIRAEQRIAELRGRISSLTQEHQTEIDRILNEARPETCEESIEYLIDASGELTWEE